MKFYDNVLVCFQAGNGGNGACSFRRVKYVPDGGPDGGNGGNGGSIILKASSNFNSLAFFHINSKHKAEDGFNGKGQNKHGKNGKDILLYVPIGTEILDENEELVLYDFLKHDDEYVICSGGRGGPGNAVFKTSTNQAPYRAIKGQKGEHGNFVLKLKLISDIGIIGCPNAGKSSLISLITNAKSKIDDYAFTTKYPILGVIKDIEQHITICDIPGLLEGACDGIGLGIEFLQHIERCKSLIHLIDASSDAISNYEIILNEIANYNEEILNKKTIVVLNKIDLIAKEKIKEIQDQFKKIKINTIPISTKEEIGIDKLIKKIIEIMQ